jgi:hypothetical protein
MSFRLFGEFSNCRNFTDCGSRTGSFPGNFRPRGFHASLSLSQNLQLYKIQEQLFGMEVIWRFLKRGSF